MEKDDNLNINMESPLSPEFLNEYIEGWRRKLWDQAFGPTLKGQFPFKKSDSFLNYDGADQAVRRAIFRYVFNVFLFYIHSF